MLGTHDLALFVVSGLLLNLTPGADSLFIATRGAAHGFKAGAWAALGVNAGCLAHVLLAAVGLSALLAASALAFTVVKWLGAAYLVVIGLGLLRQGLRPSDAGTPAAGAGPVPATTAVSHGAVFVQGFLTNVLNPKVALFFLAFVPQFIEPTAPQKALAFVFLGGIFTVNSLLWCLFLAWTASRLGARGVGPQISLWTKRAAGGLFVLLGLRLALAD